MTRGYRGDASLPPGPARDLVDMLRRLRQYRGLSVGQIAVAAGLSRSHVSEVLRGWKTPSPDAAASIARALGGSESETSKAHQWARQAQEVGTPSEPAGTRPAHRRRASAGWGRSRAGSLQLPVGEVPRDLVRPVQAKGGLADSGGSADRRDHHRLGACLPGPSSRSVSAASSAERPVKHGTVGGSSRGTARSAATSAGGLVGTRAGSADSICR